MRLAATKKTTTNSIIGDVKVWYPDIIPLCPNFNNELDPNANKCMKKGMDWSIALQEFVSSFLFILAWLLIRNSNLLKGDLSKLKNLLKPLAVGFAAFVIYTWNISFANGPFNPAVAAS